MSSDGAARRAAGRARRGLEQIAGVDLRSLAAFRVALGLAVLFDLASRAQDLGAHYTDAGVSPRAEVLTQFEFLHRWPLCLHLAGGSLWSQVLLFGLSAAAALALVVGLRTRVAIVVLWLLTTSLQLRNLYVGAGGDAQLRMMLLWGCFLPLGARASIDARVRGETPAGLCLSMATVAVVLQECIIYFSSGWAKWEVGAWREGVATAYALANDFWGTGAGRLLLRAPALTMILNHATLVLELAAPLLLLVPLAWGRLRTLGVSALAAMHVGFAIGLRVAPFSVVSLACLVFFLPPWLWDRGGRPFAAVGARLGDAGSWIEPLGRRLGPSASALAPSRLRTVTVTFLLAWVVYWNAAVLRDATHEAPGPIAWVGDLLMLRQDFRMFGQPATRTGYLVVEGHLRDGSEVDLFSDGGPLPDEPAPLPGDGAPTLGDQRVRGFRWLAFATRLAFVKRGDGQLQAYGRYLCREWNRRHSGPRVLAGLDVYFMAREVRPEVPAARPQDFERRHLWTHDCFG